MSPDRERPTPDQERAADAWRVVQRVKGGSNDKAKKEFGTQAKKLPTRILTSGLGPALAFLEAKGYAPDLRGALADWMSRKQDLPGQDKRLVVRIIHGDADFLRFATAECLAYLLWLVRFAEAEGLVDLKTE
jgi:CRISPR-associated protein Cmr5